MKKTAASAKQLRVFWAGRVQGVGFRYTAEAIALDLRIVGWVRNLPDGRVEAIVEGPEKALKVFLKRIAEGPMKTYIRQTAEQFGPATGEFKEFRIRFY